MLDLDNLLDGSGNGRHLMLGGAGAPAVAADPWGIGLAAPTFAGGQNAVADGAGYALPASNGDYTWEFRFKRDTGHLASNQVVFGRWGGAANRNNYLCYFDTANKLNYLVGSTTNVTTQTTLQTAALTTSAARVAAVVKSSGSLSLYLDGTRVAGPTANTTPNAPAATLPFRVGDYDDAATGGGLPLWGTIGDLRYSSVARYTGASYTVPTAPLASDASTTALLPMSSLAGSYLGTPAYQGHALLRTGYAQASGGWANPDGPWITLDGRWAFSVSGYNGTIWTVWAVVADTLAGLLAGSGTVQAAAIQTPVTAEGSIAGNGTVYPWGGTYHHWYHDANASGTRLRHSTGSSLGSAFPEGTTLFGPDATYVGGYADPFVRPAATGGGLEMSLIGIGSPATVRTHLRSTSTDGATWTTPTTLVPAAQPGYGTAVGEPAHVGDFPGAPRWLLADGATGSGVGRVVLGWGTRDGSTWHSLRRLFGGSGGSYVAAYDASPWYDAANDRLVVLATDSTNTLPTQPTNSDVGVWYVPLAGVTAPTAYYAGAATSSRSTTYYAF